MSRAVCRPDGGGRAVDQGQDRLFSASHRATAALHRGEPRQADGRTQYWPAPSTYASTLAVLRERDYVKLEKKRLYPEDKAASSRLSRKLLHRYVGYDFTAGLEEQLDHVSNHELDWKQVLRDFWADFSSAIDATKDLRTTQVLDSLNELLGPRTSSGQGGWLPIPAPARPAAMANCR